MEAVTECYQKMSEGLMDEESRHKHFHIIKKVFQNFTFDGTREKANKPIREGDDLEQQWTVVLGYLISATAKDFTVMVRVVDHKDGKFSSKTEEELICKGNKE